MFRLALAILGSPELAEDAAQEALVRAARNRNKLAHVDDPKAWLRRIVVRCSLTLLGERRGDSIAEGGSLPACETEVAVRDALSRLDPADRALLALTHFEGLAYAEVAELLHIPMGTVASRLHRAREAFRKEWGDA
ncbi:MAG: RNA polymerase sigma factor [Fimbriimonadaceae bacterium]|nr:RNA polymerase sigma factor [Fimbriimonadaceae bacterium]